MKIPESRFQSSSSKAPKRLFALLLITVAAGLLVGGTFLVLRSRMPLFAVRETERPVSAIELWNTGAYRDVVNTTTEQLREYPLDPTALSLRGFARFYLAVQAVDSERRHDLLVGSVQDLRRRLLLPDEELIAEVHYVLGKAYYHRGQFFYDMAIDELEIALEAGWEQLDLLEYLALASRDLGRTDAAIDYFETAIEAGDEAIHKVALAGVLIAERRYSEADRLLSEAIEQTSDVTLLQEALLSLGRSYRQQERHTAALDTYQRLLAVNESSAAARFGMGEVYLALGERERARFEWREALRLDPNHIESLQRLQEY